MTHAQEKDWLTVPMSIVIAGALIAGGIYFGITGIKTGGSYAVEANPSAAAVPAAPAANNGAPVKIAPVTAQDHIKGSLTAKALVVEYSDTECPFCKRHHETMQQIVNAFGKSEVAWVYRHYPLDQLHKKARKEAEATECAAELGGNDGFWKFTDRLFAITPANDGLDLAELPNIAEFAGINRAAFESCLSSGRHAAAVEADFKDALAAGGQGTPYTVIVTKKDAIPVYGAVPFEEMKAKIETALNNL